MRIRPCKVEEVEEILEMLKSEGILHSPEIYYLVISSYPDLALVAEDQGKIIGFVMASLMAEDVGRILILYVRRENRRRGIGSALLSEVLRRMMTKYGVKEVFLEVKKGNEVAIRLYRKFGFREERVLPKYYKEEDGILMRKKFIP